MICNYASVLFCANFPLVESTSTEKGGGVKMDSPIFSWYKNTLTWTVLCVWCRIFVPDSYSSLQLVNVKICLISPQCTVGSYCKNPSKTRFKNLWNWLIVLVPATVWLILNVKLRQEETEVMWICRNFHGKTREITLGRTYILADFWHLEPLCSVHFVGTTLKS